MLSAAAQTAPAAAAPWEREGFLQRIRAPYKHRQVFAAPRVSDGSVFGFMKNSLNAYQFAFGDGPGSLHAAAVLFGSGILLALDDSVWQRYPVMEYIALYAGDRMNRPDAHAGNPYLHARSTLNPADAESKRDGFYQDVSIEALARRGISIFVCSNALRDFAGFIAVGPHAAGRDQAAVFGELGRQLVPGAMLVPAGVATVNLLQEERFTLFQAV